MYGYKNQTFNIMDNEVISRVIEFYSFTRNFELDVLDAILKINEYSKKHDSKLFVRYCRLSGANLSKSIAGAINSVEKPALYLIESSSNTSHGEFETTTGTKYNKLLSSFTGYEVWENEDVAIIINGDGQKDIVLNNVICALPKMKCIDFTLTDLFPLFKTARNGKYNELLPIKNWIQNWIQNSDMDKAAIEEMIKKVLEGESESQIEVLKSEISNYMRRLADYKRSIDDYTKRLREANKSLNCLIQSDGKDKTERIESIMNIVYKNPAIKLERIDGHYLLFRTYNKLTVNKDSLKETLKYKNGVLFNRLRKPSDDFTYEGLVKFYTEIFSRRFSVMGESEWCLDFDYLNINSQSGFEVSDGYIGNPHHLHFSCIGQNAEDLSGLVQKRKYDELFECAIHVTSPINITESIVMESFEKDMFVTRRNEPFIMNNETGEMMTPKQVYELVNKN